LSYRLAPCPLLVPCTLSLYSLPYTTLFRSNNNALVNHTISQIEDLVIPTQTLLHSDRGYQYTSKDFKKYIEKHQLVQSMSRVGKCIDNGPMENFWGIIKEEMYRLTI